MSALAAAVAGAVGACVGSFALSLARRWDDPGRDAWLGRSRCEACGVPLRPADLVPVVSFLARRGRCRACASPIAPMHLAAELAGAVLGAVPLALLGPAAGWILAALGWWLLAAALIDLRHLVLPDALTLPLVLAGLARTVTAMPGAPSTLQAATGAAAGFLAFWALAAAWRRFRGREGLGLGDAKLYAAAGAWLGPAALPAVALLAALLGIAQAVLAGRGLRSMEPVPFGPALAAAFWLLALHQAIPA